MLFRSENQLLTPRAANLKVTLRTGSVGYDMNGIWRETTSRRYLGILLHVSNPLGAVGERVSAAENLIVSVDLQNNTGRTLLSAARSYWLGYEQNVLDLRPGEWGDALLGVIEFGTFVFYDNPNESAPVYIGRRPIPRSIRHPRRLGVFALDGTLKLRARIADVQLGETIYEYCASLPSNIPDSTGV